MVLKSKINGVSYRVALPEDADVLLKVYAPYVLNTAVTYEYEVPSEEEFRTRITNTLKKYPYIVVELDGNVVGYSYASTFHPRAAYSHCAELSIYLSDTCRRMGIGRELYSHMEDILKKQNVYNLYACIAHTEIEDEHLTNASMRFHSRVGFELIGTFKKCGYKFGNWYGMIWMEKIIGEHNKTVQEFIPFGELNK